MPLFPPNTLLTALPVPIPLKALASEKIVTESAMRNLLLLQQPAYGAGRQHYVVLQKISAPVNIAHAFQANKNGDIQLSNKNYPLSICLLSKINHYSPSNF
jgi:hypothetical protein